MACRRRVLTLCVVRCMGLIFRISWTESKTSVFSVNGRNKKPPKHKTSPDCCVSRQTSSSQIFRNRYRRIPNTCIIVAFLLPRMIRAWSDLTARSRIAVSGSGRRRHDVEPYLTLISQISQTNILRRKDPRNCLAQQKAMGPNELGQEAQTTNHRSHKI